MPSSRPRSTRRHVLAAIAVALSTGLPLAHAQDVSAPPILQMFEASWRTMENRAPDIFKTGYGALWTPPPGRADSGNQSVGYDVYDRFDLGSAGNPTLYGTQLGLKTTIDSMHKAGVNVYTDLIWNHNGFSTATTNDGQGHTFANAGGYPGFALSVPGDANGDFHDLNATGDQNMRLAGLIDIAQEKNHQYIRSPVAAGDARNLPAGTTPLFGRLANVPNPSNAQFYPDQNLGGTSVFNPRTGETVTIYRFNQNNPLAGDAVVENATGYLMRQTQWMLQTIGVDGFRIDAAKNMPSWVLNYYDQAVYQASNRTLLDGSRPQVFGFSEVFDGNMGVVQPYIRKDTTAANVVNGNRDALDFPLFFAMNNNLSSNGQQNNWNNVKNASLDVNDDGLANNGSQGVSFVSSADTTGAYLSNVAYAYTLMRPGNALVYFNAHEFGTAAQRPFPGEGRGDALGGLFGERIQKLVDIRNTHGRGNYMDRTPAADTKEMLVYERQNSALVVLSNRLDSGFDSRTVATGFAPGTPLLELTGNSADATVDPNNNLAEVIVVNNDGTANITVPRNKNVNGVEHGRGYLIYGPSGPQGALSMSNVAQTLAGGTPTSATNGTTRLADIKVVTANSFELTLNTNKVTLPGAIRDHDADGDNALVKIDEGLDLNGSGTVDFRSQGVVYGFENFTTVHQPGFTSADNNGTYTQSIDTTQLSEGYHNLTARAFRRRNDGEPAIFTDFKQTIYVDRLKPVSAVNDFAGAGSSTSTTRDLTIRSVDKTASTVNILLDVPANLTEAQILAQVGQSNSTGQIDRDLFSFRYFNVASGNHVATIISKEITGNTSVQRIPMVSATTTRGAGPGDLNFDNQYLAGDVSSLESIVYPNGAGTTNFTFNPGGDINGDGLIDSRDLYGQRDRFRAIAAPAATIAAATAAVLRRGDVNQDGQTNAADIDWLYTHLGNSGWQYDLDVSGWPTPNGASQADVDVLVRTIFQTQYGDADLNGKINFDDYTKIDNGFNNGLAGWTNGDFNGNGQINFDDYTLIDFYFNNQISAGAARAVPEPLGGIIALGAMAAAFVRRRRRRI